MKYFLLTAIQHDGEHEYQCHVTLRAPSRAIADKKAQQACEAQFSYGDDQTLIRWKYTKEIPKADAVILAKYFCSQILDVK